MNLNDQERQKILGLVSHVYTMSNSKSNEHINFDVLLLNANELKFQLLGKANGIEIFHHLEKLEGINRTEIPSWRQEFLIHVQAYLE